MLLFQLHTKLIAEPRDINSDIEGGKYNFTDWYLRISDHLFAYLDSLYQGSLLLDSE